MNTTTHATPQFENIKAVVTGASGGIGQAIASKLAEQGADLILVGRNKDKLDALKLSLERKGAQGHIECFCADLVSPASRSALVAHIAQSAVPVNTLVNSAGVSEFSLLEDASDETVHNVFDINVLSVIALCKDVLPYFKERAQHAGRVRIINVGSAFGSIAYPGFSVYSASKFAIRGFTEALSRELSDTTIEVKYFAPRATQTNINSDQVVAMNAALGVAMDTPEVVAEAFMSLLNSKKKRLFVGFPEKLFVLINSVFPKLVSASIAKQLSIIKRYAKRGVGIIG
ncbi:MAG: SDR family oxidoreductase [Formosimonas sp.]